VTVALQDMRAMSDEELRELYAADEPAALAEAARRDRADRAARSREQLRAEWYDAAYEQYLAADAECRGNLLSREGIAAGVTDEFSLWHGRADVAMRYASEELRDFWAASPRVTVGQYIAQRAAAMRAAREDVSTEEAGSDEGLARDDTGSVRQGSEAAAVEPVRSGQPGEPGGPVQRRAGGRVRVEEEPMGIADGVRVAGHLAAGAARAEERLREARANAAQGREMTGTVVRRPATPPARRLGERIPGDQLLDLLRQWIGTYARFPSPAALDAVTLWVAHSHMRDENGTLVFRATPRLYLLSSEPGSGKSKVLELLNMLCPATYGLTLEPTAAGLVHTIGKEHATVFIDEGDVMFGAGQRKSAVRAIINGGYERHGTMLNGKGSKATRVPVFGALALAGLDVLEKATGDTLTALLSRGVRIRMKKAGKDNAPAKVTRITEDQGAKMNEWLTAWASQVRDELTDYQPAMPEDVDGRAEQIWEPLVAIGDLAWRDTLARAERDGTEPPEDGGWAERARAACLELALAQDTAPVEDGESVLEEFASFAADLGGELAGTEPEYTDNWEG